MTTRRNRHAQELDIAMAANEVRGALEELVYLVMKEQGGMRHEDNKRRWSAAVLALWRACNGEDPFPKTRP